LPIILYSFRELSLVTLLSNALILPLQTQVMLWGAAATAGGLIWLPLGRVLGWVAWLFLAATIWGVETTARMPHAAAELGSVSPALVCGWYATLGAGTWLMGQTEEKRRATWHMLRRALFQWFSGRPATKMLMGGLAIVAVLVWLAVAALPDGKLHVIFLHVGGGDATFIETPSGQQVLVNGGPSPAKMTAYLGRRMPFWDRTLDLVVLTDDTNEHLAGLVPALERYRVSHLLYSAEACTRPACARWQELVRAKGVVAQQPVAGMRADLGGGLILTVLHPAGSRSTQSDASVVLRVDYGQTCFLLTGSADQEAQVAMLARGENLRCDVLQMGQGGDEGAVTTAFLEAVRPALVVLSDKEDNEAGNPTGDALGQLNLSGATIVGTGQRGSVEVVSDGVGYDVRVRH
jgi:competence protein ComEC